MKPICKDIRERVIDHKNDGYSNTEIARMLRISLSSVKEIWKLFKEKGNILPKPYLGRPSRVTESILKEIFECIDEEPDITLETMVEMLDLPVQKSQLHNILVKEGFSHKKKNFHPKNQQRPDVVEKRIEFDLFQKSAPLNKIVCLDESNLFIGMTSLYGWGRKNMRINEYVPDNRFKQVTILSSIRTNGKQATMIFKGALTKEIFALYIEKYLLPTLRKGDILVLDNLSAHKSASIFEAIIKKGAIVKFLPPYSPDLNPIELNWSRMKAIIRKLKPQDLDDLKFATELALNSIPLSMIKNWYAHCGY